MSATARTIEFVHHSRTKEWAAGASRGSDAAPFTRLKIDFDIKDPGLAHVCGIHYSTDFWRTRQTAYAKCLRVEGPYGPGGAEKWNVTVDFQGHDLETIEYVIFCIDHRGQQEIKELYHTQGGQLHRAPAAPAPQPPKPRTGEIHARASSLTRRALPAPVTLAREARTVLAVPEPRPAAFRSAQPSVPSGAYNMVCQFMSMLMLRNFSTNTWHFKTSERVSLPGCIIASPSRPDDPFTDQDYVNCWVRDAALCAREALHVAVPFARADVLDDYIAFSRTTQQNAQQQGRPGHACFHIDGTLRPWSEQSDGPALRILTVTELFPKLSTHARGVARELLKDDVAYLLGAHGHATTNLWEESHGYHFFTRAVQKRAFDRIRAEHQHLELDVDLAALQAAGTELGNRLQDHWTGGYYRSTVNGGGLGANVDASVIMGAVYGEMEAGDHQLLATAAVIRDHFRTLYSINDWDETQGVGPMVGRYPEDSYDGDPTVSPNEGHPWPLCTALLAEFYYRAAFAVKNAGVIEVNDLTRRFHQQVGIEATVHDSAAPEFGEAVAKIEQAGDRLLDAILYHSDHLELSEQCDRYSGYQKSVRNLTWSYAAFLGAVRAKSKLAS